MKRSLKVSTTGIDWYKRSTVKVKGVYYAILEAHYKALENYWILTVEKI